MNDKIKRHEFLKSLGLKGASLVAVYCGASAMSSCKNETGITPSSSTDFTLDLSQAAYSKLNTVGSYVVTQNVVVARVSSTTFAAVTQICSHEGRASVIFSSGGFYCPEHGANFDTSGKGLNANGSKGLTTYKTTLTGNSLRVYS